MSLQTSSHQHPSKNLDSRDNEINRNQIKICIFGNFGASNFGNESTLQAALSNIRRFVPDAEVTCICNFPEKVNADYKIAALPISCTIVRPWTLRYPLARFARKLFIGIPSELYRWFKGMVTLHNQDMMIVAGTGLLTDAFGNSGWGPYSTFKWSVIARLCGCQLLFLSVGAGPLQHRTGRLLIKSALALANFRSYRDEATLQYLRSIGFSASGDCVYPDLAFSLPKGSFNGFAPRKCRPMIGIGLMSYDAMYGIEKTTRVHFAAYIEALAVFSKWLVERGYDIRLLIGDLADAGTAREFKTLMSERLSPQDQERILNEPVQAVEDLLSQIAETDLAVVTRFHNILFSLFLNKPVLAVSFHHKCSALMSEMGLSEYCQDIRYLNSKDLIEKFVQLEKNSGGVKGMIKANAEHCREALDKQYSLIFREIANG